MEVMKTTNAINGIVSKAVNDEMRITAIRFIWIPGIKPVIVPARRPTKSAIMISRTILISERRIWFLFLCKV